MNTISAPAEISPCPADVETRIHPDLLTNGVWVGTPGEPDEAELAFFRALPGADAFRRYWHKHQQEVNGGHAK